MIRVGKIVATHGLTGDVIITHVTGSKGWLKKGDHLFVAIHKESHIPYFISNIKAFTNKEATISFEDVVSVEVAKKLIGKEIFVQEEVLTTSKIDSPLLWIGFELIDDTKGPVGTIEDIYQTAQQWLATIRVNGNEALIPLIDQTLKKVDIKQRQVHVDLPDGLLEIYS